MLFRLCLELGFPHPDYLLLYLDSRQLQEWLVYFEDRPFGHDIRDIQVARLSALVQASAGVRTSVEAHLLWKREETESDPEATLAMMPGGAAAMQEFLDDVAKQKSDGSHSEP